MSHNSNAAGLAIHWQFFGSNGQEKADYSKGVLERFTRCASQINPIIKSIANPRRIGFFNPAQVHTAGYFSGFFGVDENVNIVKCFQPTPATAKKIVIHHYHCKSWEEYKRKNDRGDAVYIKGDKYKRETFNSYDRNDEFDDGILKYRDERAKVYQPPKPRSDNELLRALERNLSPTLQSDTPQEFYTGKIETFLTCRAVAAYLKTRLEDDTQAKFFEEASLKAIIKSFASPVSAADKGLFNLELPELLKLPYSVVEELRSIKI